MRNKALSKKRSKANSELWYYVSCGDGVHCPFYCHCHVRQNEGWCLSDNVERISELQSANQISAQNYEFIESGTCSNIFKMVENLSESYLELGRIQCPPVPSELISLIGGQNIEIRILPFKGCNGALCYYENKWMIYLNANDTLAMRRFTLFHEAFHVLAYSHTTPIFNRIGVTRGFFNEFLADVFAGSILAPNEWIKKEWVEIQDVKKIGEIFEVPESFIWIRLKRLGII